MKTFLFTLLLLFSATTIFAQSYQCPTSIKSDQGGGSCPAFTDPATGITYEHGTAVVTLVFETAIDPNCIPHLNYVTDKNGMVRVLRSGNGTLKQNQDDVIEYCLYGEQSEDNFFNQPD